MSADYTGLVSQVAIANREEIVADLRLAEQDLQRARLDVATKERRVQTLQVLADLALSEAEVPRPGASLTLHEAMAEVLRTAPNRMMRAGDLAMEVQRRRLYTMRDGRPVEPQQIHARVGHYLHLFEKAGTFIKLRGDHSESA